MVEEELTGRLSGHCSPELHPDYPGVPCAGKTGRMGGVGTGRENGYGHRGTGRREPGERLVPEESDLCQDRHRRC